MDAISSASGSRGDAAHIGSAASSPAEELGENTSRAERFARTHVEKVLRTIASSHTRMSPPL